MEMPVHKLIQNGQYLEENAGENLCYLMLEKISWDTSTGT